MADLSTILVDGQDVNMDALRSWLLALYSLAQGGVAGVGSVLTAADLPASTGSNKIYLVTSDPTTANNGYWQDTSGGNVILTALNTALKGAPGTNGTLAPATNSDLTAGTDNTKSVTPAGLTYLGLNPLLASAIANILPRNANHLNLAGAVANTSIAADGSLTTTSGFTTSALLDVSDVADGATMALTTGAMPALATGQVAFYAANGTTLVGSRTTTATFTKPAGSKYARVASTILTNGTFQLIVGSAAPATYVPFGRTLTANSAGDPLYYDASTLTRITSALNTQKAQALSRQTVDFIYQDVNLFDINASDVVPGSYVQSSTGNLVALAGWNASGYIPVTAAQSYAFASGSTPVGLASINAAWYTANKVYISGVSISGGIATAPAGAAYVRFGTQTGSWTYFMVTAGSTLPSIYSPYQWLLDPSKVTARDSRVDTILRPWAGKKMLILGDSIAFQENWLAEFQRVTGLVKYENYGDPGQLITNMADEVTADDMAAVSVAVIPEMGTNDYGHGSATVGARTDASGDNTIYGGVYKIVDTLQGFNANVALIFGTPLQRGAYSTEPVMPAANPYGLTVQNVRDAVMDACSQRSVPCWDGYSLSGINKNTLPTWTSDNLHPYSTTGGPVMGRRFGIFVNGTGVALA